jgi:hypothetical protein
LYILLGTIPTDVETDEEPARAQFQAIGAIDAVALRLKAATADRLREYLRVDDGATASGAALGVPVIAH